MPINYVGETVSVGWLRRRRSYILDRVKDVRHDAHGAAAYWRGQLKQVDEQLEKAGVSTGGRIEDVGIV